MTIQTTRAALRFITCGSVDDGKSTLIGRLLLDSKNVLQDQLAGITRQHGQASEQIDLARLTDGLAAEREQGITIDVAWRYFSTAARKFIIGDAPGHEQYTRNMVTAASNADAAIVLIDATKLDWRSSAPQLLLQTRRHSLLLHLLRVPSLVFAINKLDAVSDPALAFANIQGAVQRFVAAAGLEAAACVPISALHGHNVVEPADGFAGYHGPALLALLERLPCTTAETALETAFPVQWVEQRHDLPASGASRRVLWGRVACGRLTVGQTLRVFPGNQQAQVAEVLGSSRQAGPVAAGLSAGVVLDRELDISRGDWLLAVDGASAGQPDSQGSNTLTATVAWMDDEAAAVGRTYWALHGHRWVKARIQRIVAGLDIQSLEKGPAQSLPANSIGTVELVFQEAIAALPFSRSRTLGALILVDTASHKTAAAVLVDG